MSTDQTLSKNAMFKSLYVESLKHVAKCLQLDEKDKVPINIEQAFPDLPSGAVEDYRTDKDYAEFRKLKDDIIMRWKALLKEMMLASKKSTDCTPILQKVWKMKRHSKVQHQSQSIQLSEAQLNTTYPRHFTVLLAIEAVLNNLENSTAGEKNQSSKYKSTVSKRTQTQEMKTSSSVHDQHVRQTSDDSDIQTSADIKKSVNTTGNKLMNDVNKIERELTTQLNQLQGKNQSLQEELNRYTQHCQKSTIPTSTKDYDTMMVENTSLKKENESLTLRLSMVAGRKLRDNNPAIADLGDTNRPGKLSEMFREIYDNSWTDVLDYITDKHNKTEKQTIRQILSSLQEVFNFCQVETRRIIKEMLKIVGYSDALRKQNTNVKDEHDGIVKSIKDIVKGTTEYRCSSTIETCKELVSVKSLLQNGSIHADTFITNCSRLCLFMCVQDPPVFLDFGFKSSDSFDTDVLSHFTSSGEIIDYLVWPVMYLNEHGAVLSKGVAQGRQK